MDADRGAAVGASVSGRLVWEIQCELPFCTKKSESLMVLLGALMVLTSHVESREMPV